MNRIIKSVVVSGFAVAATALSANASAAHVAWVWGNNPTAASYTPDAGYSFNSKGGANTIRRFGAGQYSVSIGNATGGPGVAPSAAHVIAYGGSHRCNTTDFKSVLCYNGNTPADGKFVMVYYDESSESQLAGAHLYGLRSWSSQGGTNTNRRVALGSYEVTFGRMGNYPKMGSVIVTSMHTVSRYCKVGSMRKVGTNPNSNIVASVLCFDGAGNAADSPFVASFFANPFFGASAAKRHGAFALATNPTATAAYATDPNYTFTSAKGSITAAKTGAGAYTVALNGLESSNKTAALTIAYGPGNVSCNPNNWSGAANLTNLKVTCRNGAGAMTDSKFGVLYLSDNAIPNSAYTAPVLQ